MNMQKLLIDKWLRWLCPLLHLVVCSGVMLLSSCSPATSVRPLEETDALTRDSLRYLAERHYTLGSNFEVTADSLMLQLLPLKDQMAVHRGERLVVAELMVMPADSVDSVWVKVARDQDTMGWARESDLLPRIVPIHPVSQFIHLLSRPHTVVFLAIAALLILSSLFLLAWRRKQQATPSLPPPPSDSRQPAKPAQAKHKASHPWQTLFEHHPLSVVLLWLLAVSSALCGTLQHLAPEQWAHYYFNPTLSPFHLPPLLSAYVGSVWLLLLVSLAVLEDLFHRRRLGSAVRSLLGLLSASILLGLFFLYAAVSPFLSLPCLLALTVWCFLCLRASAHYRYVCGHCGAPLRAKGICPQCGAMNE